MTPNNFLSAVLATQDMRVEDLRVIRGEAYDLDLVLYHPYTER